MPNHDERRELHKMEAEWVWQEMSDFVKLIQRYRSIYVTAVFVSIGWVLGQMVGGDASQPRTLESFRVRTDIAGVICAIPLLNVLFVMLMLEANAHIHSLARYRFLLGYEFGGNEPAWRWELWKTTREGTIRAWTNPSNVFFGLVAVATTAAALWFPLPAVRNGDSGLLRAFWWTASLFTAALLIVVVVVGLIRVSQNNVADPPTLRWNDLKVRPRKVSRMERILDRFQRVLKRWWR